MFSSGAQMRIIGIEDLNDTQLQIELQRGGRFVVYQYCVSILILTFKRPSSIYFIRSGDSPVTRGLIFSLISFLFGWWGFPWGPIYTIGSFIKNFGGGQDVTPVIVASMKPEPPAQQPAPTSRFGPVNP